MRNVKKAIAGLFIRRGDSDGGTVLAEHAHARTNTSIYSGSALCAARQAVRAATPGHRPVQRGQLAPARVASRYNGTCARAAVCVALAACSVICEDNTCSVAVHATAAAFAAAARADRSIMTLGGLVGCGVYPLQAATPSVASNNSLPPFTPPPFTSHMASAPAAVQLTREEQHILVAKKLFYGGLAFLPWLWALNAIYFRSSLFDSTASAELKKCTCGPPRPPLRAVPALLERYNSGCVS